MKTSDFDYSLPLELIAQTPVEPRDESRLMVLSRSDGSIEHRRFFEIVDYLQTGDVLVFNDSRVIPARLCGEANNNIGGECCLRHQSPNYSDRLLVVTNGVTPFHPAEHSITATLQGEVKMAA